MKMLSNNNNNSNNNNREESFRCPVCTHHWAPMASDKATYRLWQIPLTRAGAKSNLKYKKKILEEGTTNIDRVGDKYQLYDSLTNINSVTNLIEMQFKYFNKCVLQEWRLEIIRTVYVLTFTTELSYSNKRLLFSGLTVFSKCS